MIRDRVQYVPAGLESWPGRTGQIFVKLERNEKTYIKKGMGYKLIRLPDRTLHIVYESNKQHRLMDKQLDCDYMIPYQNPVELRNRINLVLVNPLHAGGGFHNVFRPHGVRIISDSGGFQMLRGISEFVHPDIPIEFYNRHTDIGMPVDLPMRTPYEPSFFDAATKMMKANDEYMIPRLTKGKVLALVSHGSNVEMRKRRLDAIYRETPVVAIAGLNTLAEDDSSRNLNALANAMYVISQTRDTTEYFHFLGVTSRFWFIVYALLAGTGYVRSVGGDSVSHRMGAITGMYKHALSYHSGRPPIQIEKLSRKSVNTCCTCPMCQAVGDLNVLADFQLCETHQIWYSEQEKDLICDSVDSYLKGHLTMKQIAEQWLPTGQHEALKVAVAYIEAVVQKGYHPMKIPKMSLFDDLSDSKMDPEIAQRYVTILKNYEKFHKKKFLK